MTEIVNVKVKYIRPEFKNLKEWCENKNNVYIGRRGIVFIDKVRYPPKDSIWANPFKLNKSKDNLHEILIKYEKYIIEKIDKDNLHEELLLLKNKNLGCWCKPCKCHGDILKKLIENDTKKILSK